MNAVDFLCLHQIALTIINFFYYLNFYYHSNNFLIVRSALRQLQTWYKIAKDSLKPQSFHHHVLFQAHPGPRPRSVPRQLCLRTRLFPAPALNSATSQPTTTTSPLFAATFARLLPNPTPAAPASTNATPSPLLEIGWT